MFRPVLSFLLFLALSFSAFATTDPVRLSLINAGFPSPDGKIHFALKVEMDSGWHSYWKIPGEGGIPLEIKAYKASNLKNLKLKWPYPKNIVLQETHNFGYEGTVVFPIEAEIIDSTKGIELGLNTTVYACSVVCQPFPRELYGRIEPGDTNLTGASTISEWIGKVPQPAKTGSVSPGKLTSANVLSFEIRDSDLLTQPSIFVDNNSDFYGVPVSIEQKQAGVWAASFQMHKSDSTSTKELSTATVIVVDETGATEYPLEFQKVQPFDFGILLTALVGGLILNLMPCVLPVLSLKLVHLTHSGNHQIRTGFIYSAVGIIISFLFMAVVLLALKSAGVAIGWGIQFQNPYFLGAMAFVVAIFAVSLLDGFVFNLPGRFGTALVKLSDGEGKTASFLQGFVATLLATPCSAPFVGTAVGYALGSSHIMLLAIFLFMGVGMALPYLAIGYLPGVAIHLPKPGKWMMWLKLFLAIGMAGTSGYLADLVHDVGSTPFSVLIVLSILITTGIFVKEKWKLLIVWSAFLVIPLLSSQLNQQDRLPWVKFQPSEISSYVQDGRTVFVNITAKWCVTCKVNEARVFSQDEVIDKLPKKFVLMRGDWTKPDPVISEFLKKFDRYGIPFNVVFSPEHPNGLMLPELLSKADLF